VRCVDALGEEIEKIGCDRFSDQEIEDARKRLAGGFSLAMEDPDFRQRRLARQCIAQGYANSFGEEKEKYLSVSKEGIFRVTDLFTRVLPRAQYAYGNVDGRRMKKFSWEEL
jgi:predicted Zn-dependent peptidase